MLQEFVCVCLSFFLIIFFGIFFSAHIYNTSTMGVLVFDLDNTVVDSSHRTPTKDGVVDIDLFMQLQTRDNIYKDTLLPLAQHMINSFDDHYIVVCTARSMTEADYEFLSDTGLHFHEIFERGKVDPSVASLPDADYKLACLSRFIETGFTFFDDNDHVIDAFSRLSNVIMIDSKLENRKLQQQQQNNEFGEMMEYTLPQLVC